MYQRKIFEAGHMHLWDAKGDNEVNEGRISHCHKECEVYYMVDGESEFHVEGRVFNLFSDSVLLIPSNYFHGWKYPPGKIHHRITIHFLPELLNKTERDYFLNLFTEPLHFMGDSQHDLKFYVHALTDCSLMELHFQKLAARIRTIALLTQIYYLRSTKAAKPVVLNERISEIVLYLEEHLKDDITMEDLSSRFHITKNHLHFIFHKMVGTPLMKYIAIKRLGLARQDILNGKQIGEAARLAGFNEYTSFYRAYKAFYGSSPSKLLSSGVNASIS